MPKDNPTGCYQTSFELPQSWDQASFTRVVFEGVNSAFYVWCNGVWVGYSQDSRLAAEFDLTPHLTTGTNTLSVMVLRWCDGSYMEGQDMWWMSGIFRSVRLMNKPIEHIKDVRVTPNLDHSYQEGELEIEVQTTRGQGLQVRTVLFDDQNEVVAQVTPVGTRPIDEKGGYDDRCHVSLPVSQPKKWLSLIHI